MNAIDIVMTLFILFIVYCVGVEWWEDANDE